MQNNKIVEMICGAFPNNFVDEDIASNPNFIFENDPSFAQRLVNDSEGNSVLVNSFIECHHYVMGGWNVIPELLNEKLYHNVLIVFVFTAVSVASFINNKLKNNAKI